MYKGKLNREQAILAAGVNAVDAVDARGCDFTNRTGFNGTAQGDAEVEFCACENLPNGDILTVYYYQTAAAADGCNERDDLNWEPNGYEIE